MSIYKLLNYIVRKVNRAEGCEVIETFLKANEQTSLEEGLLNTSMPAWKAVLNSMQIDAIISYISRAFQPVRGSSE